MLRKRSSRDVEIPTSSMADISFLLLLFFLVTTTIDVDTGIGLVLPPPVEETEIVKVKEENIIKVLVNAAGDVLINDELASLPQIHEIVANKLRTNQKLIVSIKTDRETPYRVYVAALDEIKQAYNILREEFAAQTFGRPLKELTKEQMAEVRENVKQSISIAEPERTR
ncbi:MAG: biopolymer transporter ExbD [Ignavibacteriales bacterium]|nr:biopolymer transporter ExbD [Ignavibacteriales bacterium]